MSDDRINKETLKLLEDIARKQCGFPTLETRNSDSLDFKDTAVWCVKEALIQAYNAGLSLGIAVSHMHIGRREE